MYTDGASSRRVPLFGVADHPHSLLRALRAAHKYDMPGLSRVIEVFIAEIMCYSLRTSQQVTSEQIQDLLAVYNTGCDLQLELLRSDCIWKLQGLICSEAPLNSLQTPAGWAGVPGDRVAEVFIRVVAKAAELPCSDTQESEPESVEGSPVLGQ